MSMFGERDDWFEILQHCIYCGRPFMADYVHHIVCHDCYIAKWEEDEAKKNMANNKGGGGVVGNDTPNSDSSI